MVKFMGKTFFFSNVVIRGNIIVIHSKALFPIELQFTRSRNLTLYDNRGLWKKLAQAILV